MDHTHCRVKVQCLWNKRLILHFDSKSMQNTHDNLRAPSQKFVVMLSGIHLVLALAASTHIFIAIYNGVDMYYCHIMGRKAAQQFHVNARLWVLFYPNVASLNRGTTDLVRSLGSKYSRAYTQESLWIMQSNFMSQTPSPIKQTKNSYVF